MMRTAAASVFAFLLLAPSAFAAGDPEIAALQVGLRQKGLYSGTVDGVLGPGALRPFRHTRQQSGDLGLERAALAR